MSDRTPGEADTAEESDFTDDADVAAGTGAIKHVQADDTDAQDIDPQEAEARAELDRLMEQARMKPWQKIVAVLGVLLLLIGAIFTAYEMGRASTRALDTSADAGFSRDMQTHHRQAIDLAFIVRDKSTDPALRTMAFDIITSQMEQVGEMHGWLIQWGLNQTGSQPTMTWMEGHEHAGAPGDGSAPSWDSMGMATTAQIQELNDASGVEAERIFLRLMIAHHKGGVLMAEAALDLAQKPEVRQLASAIVKAQNSEILAMQQMLDARGG